MGLAREDYDADGECVCRVAEQFVADHPGREVQDAVGRGVTTDVEFEVWRWGLLQPYARQVVDRCEGDVSRVYVVGYLVAFEQERLGKGDRPPPGSRSLEEWSPQARLWLVASAIVKAALYMVHGRGSMLAFTRGGVVVDSVHPRREQRRTRLGGSGSSDSGVGGRDEGGSG